MFAAVTGEPLPPPATLNQAQAQQYFTEMAAAEHRRGFSAFCRRAWTQLLPEVPVWNWHMDAICDHLAYVTMGEIRFLMLNVPPRHSKSMLVSVLWPAWHWLHHPGEQFLTASVDDQLARDSAILSRRLIEGLWFRSQYPGEIVLYDDENTSDMYRNRRKGYRMTAGLQSRIVGVGGTVQILDDPHDAKKVESDAVRHSAINWHDNAWRSRVNNPETCKKIYVGQRVHDQDIFGHVLEQEGNRWTVLKIPMEFDSKRPTITYKNHGDGELKELGAIFKDPREKDGEIIDPKRMSAKTVSHEKGQMSERAFEAQYNQNPIGEGGFILKRHWWRPWIQPDWRPNPGTERPMPRFNEIIQVWDTAFEPDEEADFSARTTWGLFEYTETLLDASTGKPVTGQTRTCAMLIDAFQERVDYPKLREEAIKSWQDFAPDVVLIEKKASGHSLIQELRKKGLPVKAVKLAGSAGRGGQSGNLIARAHQASLMLEKGCIFYPPRPFARKVIDEASKFPNGDHDDYVATLVIAWMYMRRYHDLQLPDDERDEISPFAWKKRATKRYA